MLNAIITHDTLRNHKNQSIDTNKSYRPSLTTDKAYQMDT